MNIWGFITGIMMFLGLISSSNPVSPPAPVPVEETTQYVSPEDMSNIGSAAPAVTDTATDTPPDILPEATSTPPEATTSEPVLLTSFKEVGVAEDTYYKKYGTYYQILLGNILPSYEKTDISVALGNTIPSNMIVNTYSGPKGDGYQIIWTDDQGTYAVATGTQAKEFTFEVPLPKIVATST